MPAIAAAILFLAYALVQANDNEEDRKARELAQWQSQQQASADYYRLKGR